MTQRPTRSGPRVSLSIDGRVRDRYVAGLVLEAWVGPRPEGHVVSYRDRDRNNCHADNLEWRHGMSRIDPAEFVRAWQASASAVEAAERIGAEYGSALALAQRLRERGVPLKQHATGRIDDEELQSLISLAQEEGE